MKKRNEINKNNNFGEKQEKICQESKWKYKVAFFSVTGLKISHLKLRIMRSFQEFVVKIETS